MSDAPATSPTRSPTLAEAIRLGVEAGLADAHVAVVGVVDVWNGNERTADVRPLVRDFHRDEAGARHSVSNPVIPRVPVFVLGCAGYSVRVPVRPGDECLIVFCERSIDAWQTGGGEQDPVDERRHHYSDAVALVGVRNLRAALAGAAWPTDRMAVGSESGGAVVEMTDAGEVLLNPGGALPVARVGDAVGPAAGMAAWLAQMTVWIAKVTAVAHGIDPTIVPPAPVVPADLGLVAAGSSTVKAGG